MKIEPWLAYVIGAGLCWGTYVPLIAFGGKELKSRYLAFLCVGVAYFLIAVLFPVVRFALGWEKVPDLKATGLTFATLAGAAGAFGALGVIFASSAAKPDDRIYIASGGKSYVVKAGPKLDVLGVNDLGDASLASPAVANGRLFIKGGRNLYCIGK